MRTHPFGKISLRQRSVRREVPARFRMILNAEERKSGMLKRVMRHPIATSDRHEVCGRARHDFPVTHEDRCFSRGHQPRFTGVKRLLNSQSFSSIHMQVSHLAPSNACHELMTEADAKQRRR